jgi:hypothetical protein
MFDWLLKLFRDISSFISKLFGKAEGKMASAEDLEYLVGKAVLDSKFRGWFLKEPMEAASSVKIQLTPAQAASIQNLDENLVEWWAQGLDQIKSDDQSFLW